MHIKRSFVEGIRSKCPHDRKRSEAVERVHKGVCVSPGRGVDETSLTVTQRSACSKKEKRGVGREGKGRREKEGERNQSSRETLSFRCRVRTQ